MTFIFRTIFSLLIISVLSAHASAQTEGASCTTVSLEAYFTRYADEIVLQRKNIAPNIKWTEPVLKDTQWISADRQIASGALSYPLVPDSQTRVAQKIKATIYDDTRVIVMNELGEFFRTYTFSPADCSTLVAIEDWMVKDELLLKNAEPGLSEKGNRCLGRGKLLSALAGPEEHWSLVQMFEASLQDYLCAADEGSTDGALSAVSISQSGMAPVLEPKVIEKLLVMAAKKEPLAMAWLSDYYCNEGDSSYDGSCKNPKQAEEMLIEAIKLGERDLLNSLGVAFERGEMATKSQQRALACYKEAMDGGDALAKRNYKKLKSGGVVLSDAVTCLE